MMHYTSQLRSIRSLKEARKIRDNDSQDEGGCAVLYVIDGGTERGPKRFTRELRD